MPLLLGRSSAFFGGWVRGGGRRVTSFRSPNPPPLQPKKGRDLKIALEPSAPTRGAIMYAPVLLPSAQGCLLVTRHFISFVFFLLRRTARTVLAAGFVSPAAVDTQPTAVGA